MALAVRDADLKNDRGELIRLLTENLAAASSSARFDWLYLANPLGKARAWIATGEAAETVGMAAAFPRSLWTAHGLIQGWVLGDFCISKKHRSLGPALLLERVVLETLTKDEDAICYDFPSSSMLSVYRRLDVAVLGEHVRYVKLLRADEKVRQVVGRGFLERGLTGVANLALRFQQLMRLLPRDIQFSVEEHSFGEEFTDFDCRNRRLHAFEGIRNAPYLNWRYRQHPEKRYSVIAARQQMELAGYAVVEIRGQEATISDLRTGELPDVLPGILTFIEIVLREKDVHSLSFPVLQGCHLNRHLPAAGFYPRETVPVVAYAGGAQCRPDICESKNWLLLYGDRES